MKAFRLFEFDKRPMKIKGNKFFAGTAIPLDNESLSKGAFTALPSGKNVELVSGGMLAMASPEAKKAYAIMKPTGISLADGFSNIPDQLEQVYIETEFAESIFKTSVQINFQLDGLDDFWIPSEFYLDSEAIYYGWFKVSEQALEVLIINYNREDVSGLVVIAKNDESIEFTL